MSDNYMSNYWRGGKSKDRVAELVAEISDLTGGKAYSKLVCNSRGEQSIQLVVEYDVKSEGSDVEDSADN